MQSEATPRLALLLLPFVFLLLCASTPARAELAHNAATAPQTRIGLPQLNNAASSVAGSADLLTAEQAFVLQSTTVSESADASPSLQLSWTIAPGYYLYREQVSIVDTQGRPLELELPAGELRKDPFFGDVRIFHGQLQALAKLPNALDHFPLQVNWQGCAEVGVCYQPQQQSLTAEQLRFEPQSGISGKADNPSASNSGFFAQLGQWIGLPQSLLLGPVAMPTGALVVLLAFFVGQWLAARSQKRSALPVEPLVFRAALIGLLMARAAYVLQWWREYWAMAPEQAMSPQSVAASLGRIVDIRDGGWNLWAGLIAALVWVLWRSRASSKNNSTTPANSNALRRLSLQALGAGAAILVIGHGLIALPRNNAPPLPAFTLVNGEAQAVDLRQYQGQPLVINLWATWCPPCRREMPVLAQAQQGRPDIRFIWINQGEDAQTVLRYLQRQHLPLSQVLLDPAQLASQYWLQRGLPSTYFYNSQGQLHSTRMGELSRASLAQHLQGIAP